MCIYLYKIIFPNVYWYIKLPKRSYWGLSTFFLQAARRPPMRTAYGNTGGALGGQITERTWRRAINLNYSRMSLCGIKTNCLLYFRVFRIGLGKVLDFTPVDF